ncbi:MAG: ABC transporter ATP-binding protein/permease [Lachnospiraceae bacterium]|nr:ABC transporter ATP-binding protein/permease [Lachnospiraceae bacterium]
MAMVLYTVIGLLGILVSFGSSLVSRDLIDIITGHQAGEVVKYFAITIGLAVGSMFFNQITNYLYMLISLKVDNEIRSEIFEKILITDWESITEYHSGDLLTRWSSDTSNISDGVLNYIPNAIMYTFKFIGSLAIVLYYDPTFAIFALLSAPVSLIMSKTLMKRMRNNNDRSARMNAKMSGFNQETFVNIQTIKAFDLVGLYGRYLKQLQQEYLDMKVDFQKLSIKTSLLMTSIGMVVSYACYGWGIYRVFSGAISYGTMTLFLSMSGNLTGALNSLVSLVPGAISLTTSARRLMDIVEMPQEDYSKRSEAEAYEEAHRSEGISLKLEHIDYTYHTGTEVFRGANFEAHPHEIVALVGPSGEGKTTLLRLILALLKPQAGEKYLYAGNKKASSDEGIELAPFSRQFFAYVPQGNTMFSGTIAENLRKVKEDATDEEIVEVLKEACAWEFVEKLPDGIYTKLHERGGGLSEGQNQRLSIARALLRKAPVLLLDEATSALDVETERRVLKNIMSDTYPRTCIVTTHRPTVLTMCSRVYSIRSLRCEVLTQDEINQRILDF